MKRRKIIFRAGELSSHVGRVLERKEKKRKGKEDRHDGNRGEKKENIEAVSLRGRGEE